MAIFYDGTKLLSLSDINGDKPEVFICTSNRSAGKTVYFNRLLVNSFLKRNEKFCLIYRYNYELDSVSDKFFKDIKGLFFPEYNMRSERRADGIFHELFLTNSTDPKDEGESCGYAISLNSADQIKKFSHLLSDVQRMMMDEFQSETNHYCSDEVDKLISVHTSIARGQGKQVRYVPVYLVGNPITLLNPYYVAMDISTRLKQDTKFLRGEGFVVEQGFVETASLAQQESAFNRAFSRSKQIAYLSQGVYLNDNYAFIEKPLGKNRYIATIRYNGCDYAIREYPDLGIIYCDDRPDGSFKNKLSITTEDHNINYVMLKRNDMFVGQLRYYFDKGCFRFKDLKCKEPVFKMLSY